jgi:hypothetical protein
MKIIIKHHETEVEINDNDNGNTTIKYSTAELIKVIEQVFIQIQATRTNEKNIQNK